MRLKKTMKATTYPESFDVLCFTHRKHFICENVETSVPLDITFRFEKIKLIFPSLRIFK